MRPILFWKGDTALLYDEQKGSEKIPLKLGNPVGESVNDSAVTKDKSCANDEAALESRVPEKDTSNRSSNQKTHAGVHRTENNHGRDHREKLQTTVVRSSHASNDGLPNG